MRQRGRFDIWSWMWSFGFLAVLQPFIPPEFAQGIRRKIRHWSRRIFTPGISCHIPEYEKSRSNKLYQDVEIYLSTLTLDEAQHLDICKSKGSKVATFSMGNDQCVYDKFDGASLKWIRHISTVRTGDLFEGRVEEKRKFTLYLSKKDKDRVMDAYIEHIEAKAKQLRREARELLLYTNSKKSNGPSRREWDSVAFSHPSCFETLALDGDLKSRILSDLDKFSKNEEFYKSVGKAWKRGYLLYGPPGTGKSSMIAAIANRMRYDIYDLELTEVKSNSELRKMLMEITNKSVIVIEDIDCSLDLSGQRKQKMEKEKKKKKGEAQPPTPPKPEKEASNLTLSGLLNFVDGLWSSCGSERIFIFTTNFAEKLDPALLRAGRMDMHIHLSYCTFSAFRVLAKNYLNLKEHELFDKVEKAFEGSFMTPAAVSELLIENQSNGHETALESLIVALGEHREDPRLKALAEEEEEEEDDDEKEEKKEKSVKEKPAVNEESTVKQKSIVKEKTVEEKSTVEEKCTVKEVVPDNQKIQENPEDTRSHHQEKTKETSDEQGSEKVFAENQQGNKTMENSLPENQTILSSGGKSEPIEDPHEANISSNGTKSSA